MALSVRHSAFSSAEHDNSYHFEDGGKLVRLKSMQPISEIVQLQVHGVEFAVDEEEEIEGVAKANAARVDERGETKRPSEILYVRNHDRLGGRWKEEEREGGEIENVTSFMLTTSLLLLPR